MKNPYKNNTAIVTGGASGIGLSLCRMLALQGATVVIADIDGVKAEQAASEMRGTGFSAYAVKLDVSDEKSVFTAVKETAAMYGSLDFYFNNAGIGISADALDLSIAQWRRIFDVNLFGVLYGTMAAYTVMVRQGCGHIVNISSMAGLAPFSINSPYTAAKYGVVGLTESLRHECAGLGVRMTLVCPGIVMTPFYDALEIIGTTRETFMKSMPRHLITPDRAAGIILKGVARNKPKIVFPLHARILWRLNRFAPFILDIINRKMVKEFRSLKK